MNPFAKMSLADCLATYFSLLATLLPFLQQPGLIVGPSIRLVTRTGSRPWGISRLQVLSLDKFSLVHWETGKLSLLICPGRKLLNLCIVLAVAGDSFKM